MTNRRIRTVAPALLGAVMLLGGAPGEGGGVLAQDFDRDRERLRECDPGSQDCDQLREQITDRLRDQLRDCDQSAEDCDQLRAQLREVEQLSEHDRDRDREHDGDRGRDGGGGGNGGGGGGGSGGGGGGRN